MGGVKEMETNLKCECPEWGIKLENTTPSNLNNTMDKVIRQTILDLNQTKTGQLEFVGKTLFDPETPIAKLNIRESLVLELAHQIIKNQFK